MATTTLNSYYYDNQLKKYVTQFAAIFAGLHVEVGKRNDTEPKLIHVPIKNASMDRVVGHIKSENTQNKPIRLPLMTFQLVNIEQAPELRKGIGQKRRNSYMPVGGVFPDDIKVVEQRMPVPYRAMLELAIWSSNQDQHYQIMEQIFTLFDPILQIQDSDDAFDWTRLTSVELVDIRFDENVPMVGDRRLINTRLGFSMPIYLSIPSNIHDKFIKDIYFRIGVIGTDVNNSYDIIADLDSQGVEYDKIFSLDDINLD